MPGIDIPDDGASTATVNSKMTAIADAIREKTGESGTLTLDAMASAIEALEVGGGMKVTYGTFTASETLSSKYSVEHGLGTTPDFGLVSLYGTATADIPTDKQAIIVYNMGPNLANALNFETGNTPSTEGAARYVSNKAEGYEMADYTRGNSDMYLIGGSSWQYLGGDSESIHIKFSSFLGFKAVAGTSFFWIALALGE